MKRFTHLLIFACCLLVGGFSARGQTSNDVTGQVETIGNPFAAQFPGGDSVYARNVWDMQVFDGRLYLGYGNSNNDPPAPNAGPVDVWYYDAAGSRFVDEYTVKDEQIERYVVIDGALYIPGHDPTEDTGKGSIYRLTDAGWQQRQTVPTALHVYDLARFEGELYAAISVSSVSHGNTLVVSDDDGETWRQLRIPIASLDDQMNVTRAWELLEVGDKLLVSVQKPVLGVVENGAEVAAQLDMPLLYQYADGVFQGLNTDPFPGEASDTRPRVARATPYLDRVVYVGAEVTSDHQWTPFGLFSIGANLDVSRYPLAAGAMPWDILARDDALYALLSQPDDAGNTVVSVIGTRDLANWCPVLQFNADTFARSFELYDGDFYFGMGTEADPLSAASGDILRVKGQFFTLPAGGC
ncbi:MAG: hypothetical protein U0521_28840 [Anaerolineae bacterium]